MATEIERKKFLLRKEDAAQRVMSSDRSFFLNQGYLDEKGITRVRTMRDTSDGETSGFLTIKGRGKLVRSEFEYEIPVEDAEELLAMCKASLEKTQHLYRLDSQSVAEIDIFKSSLAGLYLVEVEFETEEQANAFVPPPWFGSEVTKDPRYTNANLAKSGVVPVYGEEP